MYYCEFEQCIFRVEETYSLRLLSKLVTFLLVLNLDIPLLRHRIVLNLGFSWWMDFFLLNCQNDTLYAVRNYILFSYLEPIKCGLYLIFAGCLRPKTFFLALQIFLRANSSFCRLLKADEVYFWRIRLSDSRFCLE